MRNLKTLPVLFLFLLFMPKVLASTNLQDSLRKEIQKKIPDSTKANLLYNLGFSYVNLVPDSVLVYANQSLALSKKINYPEGIANANYALGAGCYRKGEIEKSEYYFNACAAIARKTGNKNLSSKAFLGLGNVNIAKSNPDSAIYYLQNAALLCQETGDFTRQATIYNNIGIIEGNQERSAGAIFYFRKSLDISYRYPETGNLVLAYSNLVEQYRKLNVLDSAKIYADSAYALALKIDDHYTRDLILLQKGMIEFKLKNYDAALGFLSQSISSFKEKGNKAEVAELWNALGTVYLKKNKTDSALYCYLKAKDIGEAIGAYFYLNFTYEGLSSTYSAKKDFKNALEYLHKYVEVQKKYLDSLNIKKVTELNAKYDAVSRQRKIDLLEKDNELKTANELRAKQMRNFSFAGIAALMVISIFGAAYFIQRQKTVRQQEEIEKQKAVMDERDRIASDMHDDLGAGLSSIKMMGELALAKPNENDRYEIRHITQSANELIDNMHIIVWSISSRNDSLEDLLLYMRKYSIEYLESHNVECTMDLPENIPVVKLSAEQRRNIFLVIKESLHNTVKHARATRVEIKTTAPPDFAFSISDNGTGYRSAEINRFGNGLKNMKRRMESLGGTFVIENNNGTTVSCYCRLEQDKSTT